jgi:hypothetical protein
MSNPRNNTLSFGADGGTIISGTDATTGNFGAIQIITDTELSAITLPQYVNTAGLVGVTLAAGTVIYGTCTSVTLVSGVAVAHKY